MQVQHIHTHYTHTHAHLNTFSDDVPYHQRSLACTVLDPESPWQKSPKTTSMPRARAICDPQRRRHKKHVTEHGVHLCTKFDAPPSQHATCRCQESGHFIVFPMEVQGAGTFRHVARKQGFSWGNGASHRVHEMVPIKLAVRRPVRRPARWRVPRPFQFHIAGWPVTGGPTAVPWAGGRSGGGRFRPARDDT